MITGLIVLIAGILALVFWFVGIRNRLVELRSEIQYRWSDVDLELTQRDELIRDATGYPEPLRAEVQQVCEAATRQRQAVWQKGGPSCASLRELVAAEEAVQALPLRDMLSGSEFEQAEQSLQRAISNYNQSVERYNHRLSQAPASWLARSGGHHVADRFAITTHSPANPAAT